MSDTRYCSKCKENTWHIDKTKIIGKEIIIINECAFCGDGGF